MGLFDRKEEPATAQEEYAVMPKALRVMIAELKGHAPVADAEVVKMPIAEVFPISAAIAVEERRKEEKRKRDEEEALKNPTIGQLVPGQGVYLGKYAPKDRDGNSLSKTFNVFAAPEDLQNGSNRTLMTYKDTLKHISKVRSWHGHNGAGYKNDTEIYKALRDGSYNGEWIIPTRDLLHGKDVDGNATQPDNILAHWKKGALSGTFCETAGSGGGYPHWYWSSTETRDDADYVYDVRLSDGNENWNHKDNNRLSCRPVRLVPTPG